MSMYVLMNGLVNLRVSWFLWEGIEISALVPGIFLFQPMMGSFHQMYSNVIRENEEISTCVLEICVSGVSTWKTFQIVDEFCGKKISKSLIYNLHNNHI